MKEAGRYACPASVRRAKLIVFTGQAVQAIDDVRLGSEHTVLALLAVPETSVARPRGRPLFAMRSKPSMPVRNLTT